jgi:DNA-binding NarL/FixJ family response regulator
MKGARKVGIYGSQLVISAIGASLREKPGFEVQEIEGSDPDIIGKLGAAPPDVILFDLAAAQPHFAISLIHTHPTIMMIGVDLANNKMLVLCGKESRLLTAEDLVQAIQAGA